MTTQVQRKQFQQIVRTSVENMLGQAAEPSDQLQILHCSQRRIDLRLFGHIADSAFKSIEVPPRIGSIEKDSSRRRLDKPDQHFHRCGFPRTVGPQVSRDVSAADCKVDVIDDVEPPIPLGEILDLEARHGY